MNPQGGMSGSLLMNMDIELNASLATADELSKELGSMWEECSSATDTPEYKSSGYRSSPVGSNEKLNKPGPVSSSRDQPTQASYFSYRPTSHPENSQSTKSLDSMTAGKYQCSPRPPSVYSADRQTAPLGQRDHSGPPRTISSDSLSSYDQRSLPRQLGHSTSPHMMRQKPSFPVYESGQSGLGSPWSLPFDRSPSPHLGYPADSSTLPRNFTICKSQDDSLGRQRPPNPWNESDLDVSYKRTPRQQQVLDKYRTLPSNIMPFSNWRESNLDMPPSQAKDMPVRMIAPYTSLLPRPTPQSPRSSPRYSQPPIISRIAIPPGSPQGQQHRPIPLSVIMRLQHPYWARENAIATWGQTGDTATFRNTQQPQPQFERPAAGMKVVTPEGPPAPVLDSGAVEPELEGLGVGVGEMMEVTPRPLSPTRLQPVLPPDADPLPQMEELLRMRAEIPRALKKRSSIDNPPAQRKQYQQIISKLLQWHKGIEDLGSDAGLSELAENLSVAAVNPEPVTQTHAAKGLRSILKTPKSESSGRRARLSPLVLLLDASLVGELDVVQSAVQEMSDPSQPNDEGITALHNAICGGHYPVVEFLVQIAANVNAPDSHGWTPLQCAASCNDCLLCEFLVRNGAAIFAVTESDGATAAQKCDPYAPNFEECEQFLRGAEESMGVQNSGVLYALWDYTPCNSDELPFREGDMVTILQRDDEGGWWWASLCGREGFVPRNYFGLFPRIRPKSMSS
ncbi:relA-associated inhibitor-like isoform X1 [Acipenser ruthenus]|uniref:relA-associated inhibitor-like isoform X1 n=1 Tax=Acipenser ruthenus TaxID=7906 RepID=UPI00145AD86A|nr:relA-associated inhibitor-like isoform X1 [Acipenser ruthenus]XP_058882688.1 relA-associated inhibitor-like isoform X1 [Acipenser ruthenus]